MNDLPPELIQFAALLDAQPEPVQTIFRYCLVLLMVEAGKVQLISIEPGESGSMCTFTTIAGDSFALLKPPLDNETEVLVIEWLRELLKEEGL